MRSARTGKIWIIIFFIAAAAFFPVPKTAGAAERPASVTVFYHGTDRAGKKIILSGAEFSLYKVGAVQDGRGVLEKPFDETGVSLDSLTAAGQKQAAEKLYKYILAHKISGSDTVIQGSGYGTFDNLERGIYLIAQKEELSYDGGFFLSSPFLVSVPELDENGAEVFDITAEPKNQWVSGKTPSVTVRPTATPAAEKNPGGSGGGSYGGASSKKGSSAVSVKTGDETPILSFLGLLILGGTAAFTVILRKRTRE